MGGTGFDSTGQQSLSTAFSGVWSNESRGPRLHSADFETKTMIRTQGNPVEAIVVMPVAVQTGLSGDGIVARYPVYAAVAVDRAHLDTITQNGLGSDRHTTLSEAAIRAGTLNAQSENAYLNDYQSGALARITQWEKTDPAVSGEIGIPLRPAANVSSKIGM